MFKHTHKIKLSFSAVAALAMGLFAATAQAGTAGYSGSECRPLKSSLGLVDYTAYGVHNASATSVVNGGTDVQVTCPIPIPFNTSTLGNLQTITVMVYDRFNGGLPSLTGTDFVCTVYYQAGGGTTVQGPTQSPHLYSVPSFSTFTFTIAKSVTAASMICSIPTATADGFSHIVKYDVTTL